MASPDDAYKLAERNITSFFNDLQLFETRLKRLIQMLMECRKAKDAETIKKCLEEFAEELKYLTERLDVMTEELNTAYNALRRLLDIYNSIDRGH
jgi:DNA-binding transcriptional regulator GbsR (MarR family)